jgi:hypothetical protein
LEFSANSVIAASLYACIQTHSGNTSAANQTLRDWAAIAKLQSDPYNREIALVTLAASQRYSGDFDGSAETIKHISGSGRSEVDKRVMESGGTFTPGLNEANLDKESDRCWAPRRRMLDLLSLGLDGFKACDVENLTDIDVEACLENAKRGKDEGEIAGRLRNLVETLGRAYADIRFKGNGWRF